MAGDRTEQVLHLAGVDLSLLRVNSKDLVQKPNQRSPIVDDLSRHTLSRFCEVQVVRFVLDYITALLEVANLLRDRALGDTELVRDVRLAGISLGGPEVPQRNQIVRHGVRDLVGAELFPELIEVLHSGSVARSPWKVNRS